MKPNIVQAQPGAAATLNAIAVAAKSYWGYPDHWIKRWRSQLTFTPDFIRANDVFVAVAGSDYIIGFYALSGAGRRLTLDHLWVRPEQIGTGIGRVMFLHTLQHAAERHAKEIVWDADPYAAGFYERMGAEQIGRVDATMDGMERYLPIYLIRIPTQAAMCSSKE